MQFTVRRADFNDVVGLSKLFFDFIGRESNMTAMRAEKISCNENYYVAVACDEDEVIGTATGIICYDIVGDCDQFMLIENVVVLPTYQRKGVGKLLMSVLENFGERNQCKYVILVSEAKRESSHKFYETIGYSIDQKGFKKSLQA